MFVSLTPRQVAGWLVNEAIVTCSNTITSCLPRVPTKKRLPGTMCEGSEKHLLISSANHLILQMNCLVQWQPNHNIILVHHVTSIQQFGPRHVAKHQNKLLAGATSIPNDVYIEHANAIGNGKKAYAPLACVSSKTYVGANFRRLG